jgi:signal transduction histidine kinase
MRPILSVHGYITGLVFATVLPFLVFSGLLVYRAATTEQSLMTRSMREAADIAADSINRRVLTLASLAESIADARTLQVGDLPMFRNRWSRQVQRDGMNLVLYDPAGQQLINTAVPEGTPLPSDPDAIKRVLVTGEMEITGLTVTAPSGKYDVSINVPVRRDDKIVFVLSLQILNVISSVIGEQTREERGTTLFDRQQLVIYRARGVDRFIGSTASREFAIATEGRDTGSYLTRSLENVPIYVAFARVETTGWIVTISVPKEVLFSIATHSLYRLMTLGICMLILGAIAAWAIGNSIAGSVSRLSRLATSIGSDMSGEKPLVTNIREVNEVASSIQAAAETLQLQARQRERVTIALQAEIERRQRTEQQLIQAQKMEALGQLTGGIAHDFNNLLGIIVGSLDILRGHWEGDPKGRQFAEEALKAAMHGSELITQMLAFARRQPLVPKRCDLNQVIGDFSRLLTRTVGEDIVLDLHLTPGVWPVLVDRVQLEAAIANLTTNARHAMPGGGVVTISTSNTTLDEAYAATHVDVTPGDYVLIEVRDTGVGIPPEILNRIFEPFFTTKEPGQGTGLGLSMVFGFLKQSGGHISVESEPGKGTTFRLYLPPHRLVEEPEPPSAAPRSGPSRNETILIVEDNTALRQVLTSQLSDGGYKVLTAADGNAALDLISREQVIDLVLTDIIMPGGMNGHELARLATHLRPNLKIILMSGYSGEAARPTPGTAGLPFLRKPYRREELLDLVRKTLNA